MRSATRGQTLSTPTRRPRRRARRGVVCILAMLFLVLFAVLALGFYFSTAMAAQVSANERASQSSQLAAESGVAFLRYQLGLLKIPATVTADKLLEEVYMQLDSHMAGTSNLGDRCIGYDGYTISIPDGTSEFVRVAPQGPSFRATIRTEGERLVMKVTGSPGTTRSQMCRAVHTEFDRVNKPSAVFDYGVASRGKVHIKSSPSTQVLGSPDPDGSILSTHPGVDAIVTGKGTIDGGLAVVSSKNDVALGGGSVGGSDNPGIIKSQHISLVKAPEFPEVETTWFKPFATSVYVAGAATQKNIRVPPNTDPTFNAGDVINGILYIESPNKVTFGGHATINGVIVFENKGSAEVNTLDFKGNVSPRAIPATSEFDAIRAASKGWAIAAPSAAVTMSGNVDGTLEGSLVASSVTLSASADLHFHDGSIITLGTTPTLVEGKTVQFSGTAADNAPLTGVRFESFFRPDPTSYREVAP